MLIVNRYHRRVVGGGQVGSGPGALDPRLGESCDGVGQSLVAEIEDVVVGQRAHVRPERCQCGQVIGVHPVTHRLAVCEFTVGGDRCLQVDQTNVGGGVIQERQHLAPGPRPIRGAGNRPVRVLGQADIPARIMHIRFVQYRCAGMGQDLIDAPAEHDVTAQHHRHYIGVTGHARPPPPHNQSHQQVV